MSLMNAEEYYSTEMDNNMNDDDGERGEESVIGYGGGYGVDTEDLTAAAIQGTSQSLIKINTPSKFKHCPACNPKSLKVVRGAGKKASSSSKKTKAKPKTKSKPKPKASTKKGGKSGGKKQPKKSGKTKTKKPKNNKKKKTPSKRK